MEDIGRLHVHLFDLKDKLKEMCPSRHISSVVREIVGAYVEGNYMILDDKVLDVIDKGNFNEAVDLLLPGLQRLREERLQVGQQGRKAKTERKEAKEREKAGIKTKEQKLAETMFNQLMGGFK